MSKLFLMSSLMLLNFSVMASTQYAAKLDCSLKIKNEENGLSLPKKLFFAVSEDGENDLLKVNGKKSSFNTDDTDEGFNTIIFYYKNTKVKAVFSYGACEITGKGTVGAEAVLRGSDDFTGDQTIFYSCNCK